MHEPTHDRARSVVAALVVILATLAVASIFAPPLGGIAVLAGALGVVALVVVARAEACQRTN